MRGAGTSAPTLRPGWAAPLCGGRPHWGPRRRPLGGLAVTRLNPPFVPLRGWRGGGGVERRESGLRAGRPDVACDGLEGRETGRDPRRPGQRRRRRGRGSGLSPGPARRRLSPVAAAGGALRVWLAGSSSRVCWRWAGGREGEKKISLSFQVSRRLREREGERCFRSSARLVSLTRGSPRCVLGRV